MKITNHLYIKYEITKAADKEPPRFTQLESFFTSHLKVLRLSNPEQGTEFIIKKDRLRKQLHVLMNINEVKADIKQLRNYKPLDLEERGMDLSSFPSDTLIKGYECQKFIASYRQQAFYATGEMAPILNQENIASFFRFDQLPGLPLMFELRLASGRQRYEAVQIERSVYDKMGFLRDYKEMNVSEVCPGQDEISIPSEMWTNFGVFNPF